MGNFLNKPLPKDLIESIENAFNEVQSEIDAIEAGKNLADIVADLTALNNLDTSSMNDGDKVEVLSDSNHDNLSTVYNLVKTGGSASWSYIGVYSVDAYNKTQTEALLALKQNVIDSLHKLSADLIDDASTINKFVTLAEKEQITLNKEAIQGIKTGRSIDTFRKVENALAQKQNIINNLNKLSADLIDDATTLNKFVTQAEKLLIGTTAQGLAQLRAEFEEFKRHPEVVDIVPTHADLASYDTSKLDDGDIVKVLVDETKNNAESYYKWTNSTWSYIGSVGPYQELLVSGVNIKTINNQSILGSGNLVVQGGGGKSSPFPEGWGTTSSTTTSQFCGQVNADATAEEGMTFLGEVEWSDLPVGLGNAEVTVEIMKGTGTSNKIIHLIITSGNLSPYRWEYTYWNDGTNVSGWIGFQPQLTFDTTPTSGSQNPITSGGVYNAIISALNTAV